MSYSTLYCVKVDSKQSEIVQLIAFNSGYTWDLLTPTKVLFTDSNYLHFGNNKYIYQSMYNTSNVPVLSIVDTVKFLTEYETLDSILIRNGLKSPDLTLKVQDYDVTIRKDGSLKFGCTELTKDTVELIIGAYKKKSKEYNGFYINNENSEVTKVILEVAKINGYRMQDSGGLSNNSFHFEVAKEGSGSYIYGDNVGMEYRYVNSAVDAIKLLSDDKAALEYIDGPKKTIIRTTSLGDRYVDVIAGESIECSSEGISLGKSEVDMLVNRYVETIKA